MIDVADSDSGVILFEQQGPLALVTIRHRPKFNAMSRGMWLQLREVFERIQADQSLRCAVISGADGHFCAGGDISEYADFRFEQSSLRDFHETEVWGGLQAMLDCDLPMVAAIEGNCMGAGVQIASCCDIRIAAASARFGAPIARLGFPMAPREAALVTRELGLCVVRQMLLEAALFSAAELKLAGFLSRVLADGEVAQAAHTSALAIAALAPQAARLNKQTIRTTIQAQAAVNPSLEAAVSIADSRRADDAYAYADSAEHREGIQAFLEKRRPSF